MLVPDRKIVRELLTRYASLRIAQSERHVPTAARELEDVSYTLCVMMGTSDISDAIAKADVLLLTEERRDAADAGGENGLTLVG
ncbi:DUF5133 domain-containing protein [Streptomyces luteogriseus]|uniref:DUF5133 domain-containing protein n=1 Tax=Streptomyces luteogriseus TaxID=68233 RepID=A0A7W7DVI2_9ACTN|nr:MULTISPECIES: DUF5133 domain-containing protein [Streptomyces]MBB4717487.1 hypothetical protein [Streptomyces luteogriseus]MCX3287809.1 DUF5133 domain-containing protein [Streptomyces sp. NEAU-H22]WMD06090.1 DUF5133 domain-containing protein [Streptomyces sp. FXY-T5]